MGLVRKLLAATLPFTKSFASLVDSVVSLFTPREERKQTNYATDKRRERRYICQSQKQAHISHIYLA